MPAKRKAAVEVSTEDASGDTSWADCTIAELKKELERRGLPKGGKKGDLIARLEVNDEGAVPTAESAAELAPKAKKAKKSKKEASPDSETEGPTAAELVQNQQRSASGEHRSRPFVPAPDNEYKKKLKKVKKERMFMLDRTKTIDSQGVACEIFDIAGSTGNIYQTTIGRSPKCTCMDARIRGNKCKHIYYALIIILKAPAHLCYQNAFLNEEIEFIFANAPITRASEEDKHTETETTGESHASIRKPVDSECPICVFDMSSNEELVWCKASCGQNFHAECFGQWKRSRGGSRVTCVYCRAEWQEESSPKKGGLADLKEMAPRVGRYRNIGHLQMYQQPKQQK